MEQKLKTGIIGCGKVAHLHARALVNAYNSDFRAVCSRSAENGSNFASGYGVSSYTGIEEMVEKEKLDVVVICTPHPAHRGPAVSAMVAGAHVMVEKPLASSLEDCDAMIDTAGKTGRTLGVISQRRFYSPSLRMHKAIKEGRIGSPVLGTVIMLGWRDREYYESDPWRGSWEHEGGGVLVNQSPHQLDLLQWFMGSPISELYGMWDNFNHPYIEVEDTAVAVLRFKNGAIGNIVVSNSQKPGIYGKVHIHGSNGASAGVQTDGGAMFIAGRSGIAEPPVNDLWTIPGEEKMLEQWVREDSDIFNSVDATEYYIRLQHEDFIDAIMSGKTPMVTGSEGRKTVEIFTALYRSQKERRPVCWPLNS
ncbi:MAG: gfo/Idh/MocA family oxidoreductase [Marinilabiliales bacterium]|nr:MAG: gfo/Idh/MocA family oxidoreductase [Marinilabiliales bacterium]